MILRICVVIPYFENPRTISRVVRDVVLQTPYPILLVDDGSEIPIDNVLYSFEVKEALETGRIQIQRLARHQGKGAALQTALKHLVKQGFTHMVTLDGDGLHLPREIGKIVDQARQNPWDLILGRRNLAGEPETWWKRWSKAFLRYCVRFETGSQIQDSRSGFRVYPLFSLQTMRFRTHRFEFEIEVLIRLLWNGVRVREVDVDTAEFDPKEHVLHFDRLWDSLRISVLNLTLVALSLLRTHNKPLDLALAAGLGVFIGCTPVYGFHTVLAALLAVVLRLNFVALWMGTHVSAPPLIPFLVMGEVYIGQHWLKIPATAGMMGHAYQWAAGSLVLGLLLGLPSSVLTWILARSLRDSETWLEQGPAKSPRAGVSYFLLRFLGEPLAERWLLWTQWPRYALAWSKRASLNEYYRVVLPHLRTWPRQRAVAEHLRFVAEMQIAAWKRELKQSSPGETLRLSPEARVISAHIGRLDLALKKDEPTTFWMDRTSGPGVELFLFANHLIPLDVSIFKIAAQKKIPVVSAFGVRGSKGFEVHALPSRHYEFSADIAAELQLYDWGQRFCTQFEFMVKKHPDQWMNLYPFFSRPPQGALQSQGVLVEDLQPPPRLRPDALDKDT